MATAAQIRGMLLEEVILALLSASGFRTVTTASDPTLHVGPSGMEVRGRASRHQIDAIADFRVAVPFTYPPRLLVEGKCYRRKSVGIEVIRNAIGVMKDIDEFFDPSGDPPLQRWHYQYSVFSATGFSKRAEDYAYAHGIFPVPLARVGALASLLDEIQRVDEALADQITEPLHEVRKAVRLAFGLAVAGPTQEVWGVPTSLTMVASAITAALGRLGGALPARMTSGLPLFLVPSGADVLWRLLDGGSMEVRIRYARENGWWIEWEGQRILNFDLPLEVFKTHDEAGMFRREQALQFKEDQLAELQAIYAPPGAPPRLIILTLSRGWIREIRRGLRREPKG